MASEAERLLAEAEGKPFSLREYIQNMISECKDDLAKVKDSPVDHLKIVASKHDANQTIAGLVNEEGAWPRKDEELSRRNREDGNTAYQEGRFEMAILLYTEALRYAPCNPVLLEGEALALAAANRSAAFYQNKLYKQAIEDIEIAISAGYPTNGLYKLYIRQCKCELELGRISKAQTAFDKAVEAIDWSGLKKNVRSDLTVNLQEAFITLSKQAKEDEEKNKLKDEDPELSLQEAEEAVIPKRFRVAKPHPNYKSASESIRVKYEPALGRHVVAARDIKPGETVFLESPLVSTVCDHHFETICLVCLRYTDCPLPCPTCSDVSFCSLKCRTQALSTFHKYECRLTHVFIQSGIEHHPVLRLAIRAITQKPVEYFMENKEKFTNHNTKYGLEEEYDPKDYSVLYHLCTHSERREDCDNYTKSIFAYFLLRCLQEVGYFRNEPGPTLSEEELLIGRLLRHFVECTQFNSHTVESAYDNRVVSWDNETRLWKSYLRCNIGDSTETVRIGGAVYPTLAMVNHSCDPNIVLVFWGRVAVAVASRSIKEGEEINDNYGANYAGMSFQERQNFLEKSHWFKCTCKACENNYPEYVKCAKDYKKLPGSAFRFKRCDRQKLNRDVEIIKKDIKACIMGGDHEGVFNNYIKWSELIDSLVYPPHQDFINIRKGIRNGVFLLSPNHCRAREVAED